AAVAGALSVFFIESGWAGTEIGRQPGVVYKFLRTPDAGTPARIAPPPFAAGVGIYVSISVAAGAALRLMCRRWASETETQPSVPYGPIGATSAAPAEPPVAALSGSRVDE